MSSARWGGQGAVCASAVAVGWFGCARERGLASGAGSGGFVGGSLSEFGELGDVVGEDAVSAPDACSGVTAESGASPAEVAFEV